MTEGKVKEQRKRCPLIVFFLATYLPLVTDQWLVSDRHFRIWTQRVTFEPQGQFCTLAMFLSLSLNLYVWSLYGGCDLIPSVHPLCSILRFFDQALHALPHA